MKRLYIFLLPFIWLIFFTQEAGGQDVSLLEFHQQSLETQQIGMAILGGWAISNLALGAYGWANSSGEQKYFGQMNFFWNTVNLSIAGFAIWNNSRTLFDEANAWNSHLTTEKILLLNAAVLDVAYIATGIYLLHRSKNASKNNELLRGYGKSLILQGGFLMAFDFVLYGLLKHQSLIANQQLNLAFTGQGLSLTIFL